MTKAIRGAMLGSFAVLAFTVAAQAALPAYPADKAVESDMAAHWGTDSKIIEIKKSGDWVNQSVTDENGKKIPQAYLNYDVRSEKDKTIHKTNVSVRYNLVEGAWVFKAAGMGEFTAEARADRQAPPKDEVKQMIKAAVEANKLQDFGSLYFMAKDPLKLPLKVSKVLMTDPKYLDSGATYGFKYVFDVHAEDAKNRKVIVSDMSYTIRKSTSGEGAWTESIGMTGIGKGTYTK